jgi:hypothetical protein
VGETSTPAALALYRLWYDLFEIAGYLSLFRHEHADDADAAESWKKLQYFLCPDERSPDSGSGQNRSR